MKHKRYATQFALFSGKFLNRSWSPLRLLAVASALSVLVACTDTAEVQTNAGSAGSKDRLYTGEPAKGGAVNFKKEFWDYLSPLDRCGSCHTSGGAASNYPFVDFANVNNAYTTARYSMLVDSQGNTTTPIYNDGRKLVDVATPSNSRVVQRVAEGHNCWGGNPPSVCATIIEGYINKWLAGSTGTGGRTIQLTPPTPKDPGASLNFPATATTAGTNGASFSSTVYPLLTSNCSGCHSETSATQQSPFFASPDVNAAYDAARGKMDLDVPSNSRFVIRLTEAHNCPNPEIDAATGDTVCTSDANQMTAAIQMFADGIAPDQVQSGMLASKALTFDDALLASGSSRYENDQIALWEFKTGTGTTAYDTSGIEPAMNLSFTGSVNWVMGYGISFSAGGKAQALTTTSKKLHTILTASNAYSIEAWVIPGNVTQEDARIISYSAGDTARNFAMSQTQYNYEFLNRTDLTDSEGRPSLMTDDNDEDLQAALQHVVMTFDATNGRRVYVNGVFTGDSDMPTSLGGSLMDWNDNYAFVLGNEVSGTNNAWNGKLRMVAIHSSALTQEQILQNYAVGVGQKYYMLFSVGHLLTDIPDTGISESYIMFEVEQYDNTAYLFDKPRFISLNGQYAATTPITIKGMRIGVNGRETISGQAYGNIDVTVNATDYTPNGQPLSRLGTVIAVEKAPNALDEFFLTFEQIGSQTNPRVEADPVVPQYPADPELASDIGVKTFDEIDASMSAITGIPRSDTNVSSTFATYKQQLPSVEDINAYLASHQMAVAQLAFSYCNALVTNDVNNGNIANQFFANFDFSQPASTAFNSQAKLDNLINPLLIGLMNIDTATPTNNLSTQPDVTEIRDLLSAQTTQPTITSHTGSVYAHDSLIKTMQQCYQTTTPTCSDNSQRTIAIAKAVCAATLGSALILIQ